MPNVTTILIAFPLLSPPVTRDVPVSGRERFSVVLFFPGSFTNRVDHVGNRPGAESVRHPVRHQTSGVDADSVPYQRSGALSSPALYLPGARGLPYVSVDIVPRDSVAAVLFIALLEKEGVLDLPEGEPQRKAIGGGEGRAVYLL